MVWTRREFVKAGTALAAFGNLSTDAALAAVGMPSATNLGRMAFTPATWYRPYVSKVAHAAETSTWVQIDLGSVQEVERVRLYPAFGLGEKHMAGHGFPKRFKVEGSNDALFSNSRVIVDQTRAEFSNPDDLMTEYATPGATARYLRLTATELRPAADGVGFALALAKVEVISEGRDIAEGCAVTGDVQYGNSKDLPQITRRTRPMGEGIVTDNPQNVIPADRWQAVPYKTAAPLTGVSLQDGIFRRAMENNIGYLLSSFSVEEMLRPFRERAGKPVRAGLRQPIAFWDTELPGSSAGRFLMGAGNTLRWIEHPELLAWMNAIVDGIEECRQANGYIMAYPEDTIFESERGAYTRAWVTHGLIEAGYAGNRKAFHLLRGYYDWYDNCAYLPKLLRGAAQGVQGMVANTRMYFTPAGKPEDLQVVQRYFQENYWLEGLAGRNTEVVWQYPYDRPHNYLVTDFEAYLDLFRATGDERYLRAMQGAWELFHDNWEHVGGSMAITEFGEFPPKSYRLEAQMPFCETGETCGSVFWTRFNQRFQLLDPEQEKYAAEIEKSIYNVGLANQVGSRGIIYHARLVGQKGDLAVPLCTNSCCEGQGTRLLGSLPEYIYSIAADGVYVNLFEPSKLTWKHAGETVEIEMSGNFPFSPEVRLAVRSAKPARMNLRIRVPGWAAGEMEILKDGGRIANGQPGTYVSLDRTWSPGEAVFFSLPMEFRMTHYIGLDRIAGHERFAFEYGPILMAVSGSSDAALKVGNGGEHRDILKQIHADPDQPLHFRIEGHPEFALVPYWKVLSEPFTCFPVVDVS